MAIRELGGGRAVNEVGGFTQQGRLNRQGRFVADDPGKTDKRETEIDNFATSRIRKRLTPDQIQSNTRELRESAARGGRNERLPQSVYGNLLAGRSALQGIDGTSLLFGSFSGAPSDGNLSGQGKLSKLKQAGLQDERRRGGNLQGSIESQRKTDFSQFANLNQRGLTPQSQVEKAEQRPGEGFFPDPFSQKIPDGGFISSEDPFMKKSVSRQTAEAVGEKAELREEFKPELEGIKSDENAFIANELKSDEEYQADVRKFARPEWDHGQGRENLANAKKRAEKRARNKFYQTTDASSRTEEIQNRYLMGLSELNSVQAKRLLDEANNIGLSNSDAFENIQDALGEIEARQRIADSREFDDRTRRSNNQGSLLQDRADASKAEQEELARQAISDSEEVRNKRKASLLRNNKGKFKYDDEGNLDAETIGLIDRLETSAEDDHQKRVKSINSKLSSNLKSISADLSDSLYDLEESNIARYDKLESERRSREDAYNMMFLKEQFDIRAEQRKTTGSESLQLKGSPETGYFNYNPITGEATPVQDSGGMLSSMQGNTKVTFESLDGDQQANVLRLGPLLYGKRISDKETANLVSFLSKPENEGLGDVEVLYKIRGYKAPDGFDADFGENLLGLVQQYTDEDGLAGYDLRGLSTLIRDGKYASAVNKVERTVLKEAKSELGEDFFNETTARLYIQKSNELKNKVQQLIDSGLVTEDDAFSGSLENFLGRFKGTKFQEIQADATNLIKFFANSFMGANMTANEINFYSGILPQITDSPENFSVKTDSFVRDTMENINQMRDDFGLKRLNQSTLFDKNLRARLYYPDEANQKRAQELMNKQSSSSGEKDFWYEAPRRGDTRQDPGFQQGVSILANDLGVEVDDVITAIGIETAGTFDPAIKNPTSSGTGYIQFMRSTAKGLGTTPEEIAKMEPSEQLELVGRYFENKKDKISDVGDMYLAIAAPAFLGKSPDTEVYKKGTNSYKLNPGWIGPDGRITVQSIKNSAIKRKGQYTS